MAEPVAQRDPLEDLRPAVKSIAVAPFVFCADIISLKPTANAVLPPRHPRLRRVRCRTVARVPFLPDDARCGVDRVDQFGPVTYLCRSFDHVTCSKGEEPWAQAERMNFVRLRCGSR